MWYVSKNKDGEYLKDDNNNRIINIGIITKNNIDRLISERINYYDVINSDDFIFNADMSSLYPTTMDGNILLNVKYPVGCSRWSNQPKIEFKNNKIRFYEIEYLPPKN